MREFLRPDAAAVLPEAEPVFAQQGIPAGADPGPAARALLAQALDLLRESAEPVALWQDASRAEFDAVHHGAGRNADPTPLAGIAPRAERRALFAVTLGPRLGARISSLFAERDFALACMLDAAASEAVECTGDLLQEHLRRRWTPAPPAPAPALLRYSPGYCGWHLSGQGALFAALRPEEAGITLRESFLMDPLKSMTGVVVSGPPEIHRFSPDYPFCADCRTRGCRRRLAGLAPATPEGES